MYSGLEWPTRYFDGAFTPPFRGDMPGEGSRIGHDANDENVLFEDACFSFRSSRTPLCGLAYKRVQSAWVVVWGTPVPSPGRDAFDDFARVGNGDFSGIKSMSGSWIAVVYSETERKLCIVNDCLGTRPVLYHQDSPGSRLTFASDVSRLKDIANLSASINPDVLASWIWYRYNIASTAILAETMHIAPGSVLSIDSDGRCDETPYLTVHDAPKFDNQSQLIECFEHFIGRACKSAIQYNAAVNLLLSGGWDSRYLLAHLINQGGNRTNLRLTTVDHYGEAKSASNVARAVGLPLVIIAGEVYPDDSFEKPFFRALEGLAFTRHATDLAAKRHPGITAIQGYLGDSLVRGKNARQLKLERGVGIRAQAEQIADRLRVIPDGILRDDVMQEIRQRVIELTVSLLSSHLAGKPAQTFDMFGRQRRYIVNNFLQHIETNEVYLPFLSWELISHYLYEDNGNLNESLYPEMFRIFHPVLGNVQRHENVDCTADHVSRKATEWTAISIGALVSGNTSGFLQKWRLAPRILLAPFRSKQFYAVRTVAAICVQLEMVKRMTGDSNLNLRSVFVS